MAMILVIDDNPVVGELIASTLTDAGHAVFIAADGEAGLKYFIANAPGLVITDIFMPEKDGLHTIREIHRLSPQTPIIAMSASDAYLEAARVFGAAHIILKPVHLKDLASRVEQLLA